jgi:hypothetical protein
MSISLSCSVHRHQLHSMLPQRIPLHRLYCRICSRPDPTIPCPTNWCHMSKMLYLLLENFRSRRYIHAHLFWRLAHAPSTLDPSRTLLLFRHHCSLRGRYSRCSTGFGKSRYLNLWTHPSASSLPVDSTRHCPSACTSG